jgi:hypothetical protein
VAGPMLTEAAPVYVGLANVPAADNVVGPTATAAAPI